MKNFGFIVACILYLAIFSLGGSIFLWVVYDGPSNPFERYKEIKTREEQLKFKQDSIDLELQKIKLDLQKLKNEN